MSRPPAWARLLLRLAIPADRRRDVLGDLEEAHQARRGRGAARAWLGSGLEALSIAVAFLSYRWSARVPRSRRWLTAAELRQTLRLWRKQPLLNGTAFVALAVGVGLTNFGFAAVDHLLFSRLPYANGDAFFLVDVADEATRARTVLEPDRYRFLARNAEALDFLGGKDHELLVLRHDNGEHEQVWGVKMSPGAFAHLPARPLLGRTLVEADGEPGAEAVVAIRESLWRSRYGARDDIVGRRLEVTGDSRAIVGVLPDNFEFPNSPLVWLPLDNARLGGDETALPSGVELFGVVGAQDDLGSAQRQITQLSRLYETETPGAPRLRLRVHGFTRPADPGGDLGMAAAFLAVLLLVLVLIAATVGNLILVRTSGRTRELAVRSALGADRSRLVAQLVAETALMVVLAAALGYLLSHEFLERLAESLQVPFWFDLSANPRTALAAGGVALIASVAAGLLPALRATGGHLAETLQGTGSRTAGVELGQLASGVAIAELALAVALVTTALGAARTIASYTTRAADVPPASVLTAQPRLPEPGPPEGSGGSADELRFEALTEGRDKALEVIRALPGVTASGAGTTLPGKEAGIRRVHLEGAAVRSDPAASRASVAGVGPGYLEALTGGALAGRLFSADDAREDRLVAVVNRAFVERYLGGGGAVGRRIRFEQEGDSPRQWIEIVGVVANLPMSIVDPTLQAGIYLPMGPRRQFDLVVRVAAGDATRLVPELTTALAELDPRISLRRVQLLEDVPREEAFPVILFTSGVTLLGLSAMFLSLVGVFAITATSVSQRTREIGIRRALGAPHAAILRLVSERTLVQTVLGGLLGIGIGIPVSSAMRTLAAEFPAFDPWLAAAVATTLAAASAAACWVPSRQALAVSPSTALVGGRGRSER